MMPVEIAFAAGLLVGVFTGAAITVTVCQQGICWGRYLRTGSAAPEARRPDDAAAGGMMGTPLNDHDATQPLYADAYYDGRTMRVQVTMVGTIQARGAASFDGAAYLSVDPDYLRAWLLEVSASLNRLAPPPDRSQP